MDLLFLIYVFIIVFFVNLIPIFGPPTWMVLAFISLTYPSPNFAPLIFTAVCASTLGRGVLTLSSEKIIRNHFLGEGYKRNINHLKENLKKKPLTISTVFLAEAFTPLPSDQFFIAYGLTGLKLRYALVPFFIGRVFTYSLWIYVATEAAKVIAADSLTSFSFISTQFIIVELAILFLLFLFVKIDWQYFILRRKFRFFMN